MTAKQVPGPSRTTEENATFVQVVQAHAEDFLQKMDSTVLARQLGTLGLIPQTVENEVLKSMNTKDANAHLLNHLKRNANEKGVTEVFRVASQEEGYPNMNAFAAMMLRTLQQATPPTQPEGPAQTGTDSSAATPPTQPEGPAQTGTDSAAATMCPWNKEALNIMRQGLGNVHMDVVMIKKLKKSYIPSPDNIGFLSPEQLQEVESKTTPTGQMNKVIDYLVEMEDIHFKNFCTILKDGGFKAKAEQLEEKAKDLKRFVERQFPTSLKELSVSPPKIEVSSLQAKEGSDPPEREDLLADEAALKRLCWIPFDIQTVSIEAKGGILCLEPQSDDIQVAKEDTIFVEVPPDAVSTSADVKMRYAIIPSGSFTLPEGYQFGSPVVYIYYDGQCVTKPLALHLPHWYGGKDHARDGLSFAVAPHSLKGRSVYHFQLRAGEKFHSRYGVVEIGGHCSLFTAAFKNGATVNCQAFSLIKEKEEVTECHAECNIAVTNAVYCWRRILLKNRPGWEVSLPNPFQFKSDKVTATLKETSHVNGDWRAYFTGTSQLLSSHVRYDVSGIHSENALEDAVKDYAYPPTIKYIVKYRKELKRTGRSTEVTLQLHISDTDQPMNFPCTAYERIQVSPARFPHTQAENTLSVCSPLGEASSFAPPPYNLGPAQTETTSQTHPSIPLREAGLAPPPYSPGPAQTETTSQTHPSMPWEAGHAQEDDRIAETPPQSGDDSNGSSEGSSFSIN